MKRYKWKKDIWTAHRDKMILKMWEKGQITDRECAKLLSENNGKEMKPEDLPEIAAGLGWFKEGDYEESDQGDQELSEDNNSEVCCS